MAEITTYRTSIPSLARTIDDEVLRNIGLVNEIKEGDEINYANSALAREELDLLIANHSKDGPVTFNKSLVGQAQVRASVIDNLHAKILYPEAAPPAATLEGIMEQLEAMRAEFRVGLGSLRADFGGIRQEALNDRISLTNAQMMNFTIKKDSFKGIAEGLPPIPVHKVVNLNTIIRSGKSQAIPLTLASRFPDQGFKKP